MARIIAAEKDTARIYRLCGVCEPKVEVLGVGLRTEDPGVYIVWLVV